MGNFFCIFLYNLVIIKPEIYSGGGFVTFLISSFFIMFLIWKAIHYFMLMRIVLNTTIGEIIITMVSALIFTALMLIDSKVGLKVAMI